MRGGGRDGGRDVEYDLREHITTRGGGGGGQLVQRAPTVIDEPVIEHEHHHLHHHIDHGDVNSRLGLGRSSRPNMGREYSYDDLDVHERRFANGTTVSDIHHVHDHDAQSERQHRHRHRHRSGRKEVERTRYSRSEVDLYDMERREREREDELVDDNVTVVDVAPGTRRVYVKVQAGQPQEDPRSSRGDLREERSESVDWRREHGVRRSRGLGNELWTEMTKDLVTREAIEELGYPYEETEYFYYIFEYLDSEQIAELRDLTDDIRHGMLIKRSLMGYLY